MRLPYRAPCLLLALSLLVLPALAQGPDVIVGDLTGPSSYGSVGQIAAFAVGTTSCNVGDTVLDWISSNNQHPVIAQNLYRLSEDGRFEQVGMSWLKHGFTALQQSLCGPCTPNPGGGSGLGVGCSDPYSSGLNGSQGGLGPRFEVNAATGYFPYPFTSSPITPTIGRRLQVHENDLDAGMNPNALYFTEGHYIAADDSMAGNDDNNVSWREATVSGAAGNYVLSHQGTTVREQAAIEGWASIDPGVHLEYIDIPGDGRMILGVRAYPQPSGTTRYEIALYNMNSDRSAGSLDIALPAGAAVTNVGFTDVDHHSGEPTDGTDWMSAAAANGISWMVTQDYATNPDANALRWGTMFSFRFESTAVPGDITIGLFKPATPSSTPTSIVIPAIPFPQPEWQVNNDGASLTINNGSNNAFVGPIQTQVVFNETTTLDYASTTAAGMPYDVLVNLAPAVPAWFTTANGQIANIDITDPSTGALNGNFATTMPATGLSMTFPAPAAVLDFTLQMVVVNPAHPDGLSLSACNELSIIAPPRVLVEAVGANSYNSTTTSGFWRVTHLGNVPANVASVEFSFTGITGPAASNFFDTDQTGMSGQFNLGTTYRNNSAVLCGLDFSVSSPFAGSGFIGSDVLTGASMRTIEFQFIGGQFNNKLFEFDADTDGGLTSGGNMAGMAVTVTFDDLSTASGALEADPTNPQRSFVRIF